MREITDKKQLAIKSIYILFATVFAAVFVQTLFFNVHFHYNPFLQLPLLFAWAVFIAAAGAVAYKQRTWVLHNRYLLLAAVMLFIFLVQLWVGTVTRQHIDHDSGKIFNGAVIYATKGDGIAFEEYKTYFHHFTNNTVPFLILTSLFSLCNMFGITAFYSIYVFVGHLLFAIAILFTFLYLEKAFGASAALVSLLFYAGYLPVYFQSSVMYTDTMSIWAAPLMLYLYECSNPPKKLHTRLVLYFCIGIVAGVGGAVKATVLIAAIAIVIVKVLAGNVKQVLALVCVAGFGFSVVTACFNVWAHTEIYDETRAEEAIPITFWPMMGLTGDGSYNPYDEWVINAQVFGKTARTKLHLQVIKERLEEMGAGGYASFLVRKACRTFGCGTGDVNTMLVRQPDNPGHFIYRFISAQGDFFRLFNNLSQCVYVSFYLFAVLGVVAGLREKAIQSRYLQNAAPFLALLGFFAFMLIWEANHRQLVNQWPLLVMAASVGVCTILKFFKNWLIKKQF